MNSRKLAPTNSCDQAEEFGAKLKNRDEFEALGTSLKQLFQRFKLFGRYGNVFLKAL